MKAPFVLGCKFEGIFVQRYVTSDSLKSSFYTDYCCGKIFTISKKGMLGGEKYQY